jgi:hypothetical protein
MRVTMTQAGCTLTREDGDPKLYHESTVGYHMKKLLNQLPIGYEFVRMNPSRHSLTSCKLGLIDHRAGIILWHERYAIENAATEFNGGGVFFQRVMTDEAEYESDRRLAKMRERRYHVEAF